MADDPLPADATRSQPPADATRAVPPPDATRTADATAGDTADDADATAILAPPASPDSLGRLGHYEVLEVLGRGGFGIVYRAFDDKLQRVVAVKVLAPHLSAAPTARQRFLREARSAAAVKHPHVVQVHAVEEQPLPYLVMEYLPGPTLQQRLDRGGPLPLPELLRVGRQIAAGLAAAHATGLVHRDIKPSNVLLDTGPDPAARITDFGLARAADDTSLTRTGTVAGTPIYMSPEQARGEAIDHRSDLFSLGSVLYALATGRPPFPAGNTLAVLKRVVEDTPQPIRDLNPEVPDWFARIVQKLHAKAPAERFQTAAEVAELLADCERQLAESNKLTDTSRIPAARPKGLTLMVVCGALIGAVLFWGAIWASGLLSRHPAPVSVDTPEPPVTRSDAERLLGEWSVVSGERGGEACTPQTGEETTIQFRENQFQILSSMMCEANPDGIRLSTHPSGLKRVVLAKGTYRVDPAHEEVLLTLQTDRRQLRIIARYAFEGERLRLTFSDEVVGHLILTERLRKLKRLAELAAALHEYHDADGAFPPPGLPAPRGTDLKPLLSWRVAVLPYIGEEDLYRQFRLNEPWDSEHNKMLIPQMPKAFTVPGVEAPPGQTHYQVFSGAGTALEPWSASRKGPRIAEITDGTSYTLLVAEAAEPVIWTKPEDLPYDRKKPLPKLRFANGGANVVFADGTANTLSNSISEDVLRSLITRDGGEVAVKDLVSIDNVQVIEFVRTQAVLQNDPPTKPTVLAPTVMFRTEPTATPPSSKLPATRSTSSGGR
jgi:uncharacterized protein (TIGR03067 family)